MISDTIFKSFCSVGSRVGFDKPFSDGKYSYATDGAHIVRVERRDVFATGLPASAGKGPIAIDKIPFNPLGSGQWMKIPEYSLGEKQLCFCCRGTGFSIICDECEGEGSFVLDSGKNLYEVQCKSCGGMGRLWQSSGNSAGNNTCSPCRGKGFFWGNDDGVMVGDRLFDPRRIELFRILPGVRMWSEDYGDFLCFKFDGGAAALMRMRVNEEIYHF